MYHCKNKLVVLAITELRQFHDSHAFPC